MKLKKRALTKIKQMVIDELEDLNQIDLGKIGQGLRENHEDKEVAEAVLQYAIRNHLLDSKLTFTRLPSREFTIDIHEATAILWSGYNPHLEYDNEPQIFIAGPNGPIKTDVRDAYPHGFLELSSFLSSRK